MELTDDEDQNLPVQHRRGVRANLAAFGPVDTKLGVVHVCTLYIA